MNKYHALLGSLLIVLCAPIFIYVLNNYRSTHFACKANYSAVKNNAVLISKNSLIINGQEGTWMMDGKISYPNADPVVFKLRNSFKLERTYFSYHFHSQKVAITPDDDSYAVLLNNFLADVIVKVNKDSFFYIYPVGGGYVFSSGSMPVMFCNKI